MNLVIKSIYCLNNLFMVGFIRTVKLINTTINRGFIMKDLTLTVINSNLPSYLNVVTNGTKRLQGRIQIENGATPIWNDNTSTLLLNEDDGLVTHSFGASPSVNGSVVSYSTIPLPNGNGGFLPFGFKLDSNTGLMTGNTMQNIINDEPMPFYEYELPVWVTPTGKLATLNERTDFDTQLIAEKHEGANSVSYRVVSGTLPFGVSLNPLSGELHGNVNEILILEDEFTPEDRRIKPRWNTITGMIGVFDEQSQVDISINSTSNNGNVWYNVIRGELPLGLKLNPITGSIVGQLRDNLYTVTPEDDSTIQRIIPIPVWQTSRDSLPVLKENIQFSLLLETSHPTIYGKVTHKIQAGALPFGVTLNPDTGELSGVVNEILRELPENDYELPVISNPPKWITSNTQIQFDEREIVDFQYNALANNLNFIDEDGTISSERQNVHYFITNGELPMGLKLNPNGTLHGTVVDVMRTRDIADRIVFDTTTNKPVWNTAIGSLGRYKENTDISLQLDANGTSNVVYKIQSGALPFGVTLNPITGLIDGNVGEILTLLPADLSDIGSPTITSDTNIGNFTVGSEVDYRINVDVYTGRQVLEYIIVTDNDLHSSLPLGLKLSTDGRLSGVLSSLNASGEYAVSVLVRDSIGLVDTETFTLSIVE